MVRSVAERAYFPTRNLLEEIGDMMILTGRTVFSALRPPYPFGGEFVAQFLFALRLGVVSAAGLDRLPLLRGSGSSGGELPDDLRCARPPRRVLRARRRARDRPERDRYRRRRRRRHRDYRRPRRAQGARGARRTAGARRGPRQEPRRAAVPRADARHRPLRYLCRCCSGSSAASSPRSSTHSRSDRSGRRSSRTRPRPTCGGRCSSARSTARSSRSSAATRAWPRLAAPRASGAPSTRRS